MLRDIETVGKRTLSWAQGNNARHALVATEAHELVAMIATSHDHDLATIPATSTQTTKIS